MPLIGHNKVYIRSLNSEDRQFFCKTPSCCDTSQVNDHEADYMVLNCMDFRLRDNLTCQLNNKGMKNNYDEFILAGASLGYNGITGYTWDTVFEDHINLAHTLHGVSTIMLIDHMNCGAYKYQYPSITLGSTEERDLHLSNLHAAKLKLQAKYGEQYSIETYLLSIDGCTLERIE